MGTETAKASVLFGGLEFTREELLDRAAKQIVKQLDVDTGTDYSDEDSECGSRLVERVGAQIRSEVTKNTTAAVEIAVRKICDECQTPIFLEAIRKTVLQKTNKWGEAQGEPMSFTEFLIATAERYLTEPVDYNGNSKSEKTYDWRGHDTRLNTAIHKHIQYHLELSIKSIVSRANEVFGKSLEQTMKLKLNEIAEKLRLDIKTS